MSDRSGRDMVVLQVELLQKSQAEPGKAVKEPVPGKLVAGWATQSQFCDVGNRWAEVPLLFKSRPGSSER